MSAESPSSKLDPLNYRGLVRTIVGDYRRRGVDLADLFQEGFLGLMWACERYDDQGRTPFQVFATRLIHQAIRAALVKYAFPIRLPHYLYRLRAGIHHGRIDPEIDLSATRRARLREATPFFDRPPQEAGLDDARRTFDGLAIAPEEEPGDADEVPRLLRAVAGLPRRHREILRMRYGLDGTAPKTLPEVGAELGQTKQRVHQLEREAIASLRGTLADRARRSEYPRGPIQDRIDRGDPPRHAG